MIAHILQKSSRSFAGVKYNTNKVDRNKGELMLTANFGPIQALKNPRPQDLTNYLLMVAAQNKKIANSQFHAVISSRGKMYNKHELTQAAVLWIKEMGYGEQPHLIVFHKDTENNHVHIVSSRIDRNGRQIDRDYEQVKAVRNIDKVLGYSEAMQYNFSTKAQFYLILERRGFLGRDYINEKKLNEKIASHRPDKDRIAELKALFQGIKKDPDSINLLKSRHQLDLVFHASEGKKPYGYTVIDHATKQVFKGSEILSLKYLLDDSVKYNIPKRSGQAFPGDDIYTLSATYHLSKEFGSEDRIDAPVYIGPIFIAHDVDDQQVLGMKRRRQKNARTNTR